MISLAAFKTQTVRNNIENNYPLEIRHPMKTEKQERNIKQIKPKSKTSTQKRYSDFVHNKSKSGENRLHLEK